MPADEQYRRQVALLVQMLPFFAEEVHFALKGGTAINLFIRDLPRLSEAGKPHWDLLDVQDAERLPAIRWRMQILGKLDTERRGDSRN